MSINIGKDCWNIIAKYGLSTKDLLSLRLTCKYLNGIVKSMNEEWFKAHQWFLISKANKSKAKSAVRLHSRGIGPDCVSDHHPEIQKITNNGGGFFAYDWYNRKRDAKIKLIDDGVVTIDDCKVKYHWKQIVPKSRNDIPHDGYKKNNIYIYYYLIECYRYYNKKHETELKRVEQEINELKKHVDQYNYLLTKKDELKQKYVNNEIFKDCRVTSYKSI